MKITLTVTEGPHQGASFEFRDHDTFLVGRSPDAQFRLPLKDIALSRTHFLVEVNPPLCRLMDMASTNGVRINGKKVHTADLRDGDRIQAGNTALTFAIVPDAAKEDESTILWPATYVGPSDTTPDRVAAVSPYPGFAIDRTLGEGGMGVVHLARRESDGAAVALKVIRSAHAADDVVLSRFLREASILRKLDHRHIVRFLEIGFAHGQIFFAMEYVEGKNAADLINTKGPMPIQVAAGLGCQALEALQYAHSLGFVHRDIKPENILLSKHEGKTRLKLADFGLARIYQDSSLSGLSVTGQAGGTLAYMPPEQITHFRDAKPPADLYALGATLYNLLTGARLFDSRGRTDKLVAMILSDTPIPLQSRRPEVPNGLAEIIHKALEKKPEDRFANATAMRDALRPFATL